MRDLKMDRSFEDELWHFFKNNWEYQAGSADDFILEFQEWLNKTGFDLTCIIQYKTKE